MWTKNKTSKFRIMKSKIKYNVKGKVDDCLLKTISCAKIM